MKGRICGESAVDHISPDFEAKVELGECISMMTRGSPLPGQSTGARSALGIIRVFSVGVNPAVLVYAETRSYMKRGNRSVKQISCEVVKRFSL